MLLSIIIPHYNSVHSLTRLLDSIPSLPYIQIIVVDDNSNPSNKKRLVEIRKDTTKNILILNNLSENKGAGACRNIGLQHASGNWVLFADADDFFMKDSFKVIDKYINSDYDVIFFKPTSIEEDTGKLSDRHLPFVELIDNLLENNSLKDEFQLRYRYIVPWSKLIKKSFIDQHNIYFDEVISANDVMFSTRVGHFMEQYKLSEEVIYCVTKNKGSLTMTISNEMFNSRLNVFICYYNFLKTNLSKNDFKLLNLSGRGYLVNSIKFGYKQTFLVLVKLISKKINIFDRKLLNPFWIIKKVFIFNEKQKSEKKYYDEVKK